MNCEKCVTPEQLRILLARDNPEVIAVRTDGGTILAKIIASTDPRSVYYIGSARNPARAREFKTFDALVSHLERMGATTFTIKHGA